MRLTIATTLFLLALASFLMLPVGEAPERVQAGTTTGKGKLVVLVVFDQMRGDYLQKWRPVFGDGGFKRLQDDGAWFTNCHYPYAYTLTAAGHASMSTGTIPTRHGIIANDWYDRADADSVSSVTPRPDDIAKGVGPHRLKAETVGDVLLRVLLGKGRVASMSIKDRSAILLAAVRAGICYWFSTTSGNFVTSPYYRPDPHPWAIKFNKARAIDQWLGQTWQHFDPKLDYVKHSGPDDVLLEGTGYNQGRTFPHPFKLGSTKEDKLNKQYYHAAVLNSPMGNDLLLQFAKTAIVSEKLGQADSVDLLCISFSSNDLVGHCWGPDSQEVLDTTLRSDALIKDLLGFLDVKVGKANYYLAMCADHGVCPLPEVARQQGKIADRVDPNVLTSRAEEFLNKKFLASGKKAPWFEEPEKSNAWVYLNYATLKELQLSQATVETALARWFDQQPGIEKAFTRTELMKEEAKEQTELFRMVQRSFHPDCSGDVMVVLKPYHLFSPPTLSKNPDKLTSFRTSHGTPHPYDTHVPLLVMGPRIEPGVRDSRVTPQAMASILAEALGVPRPKDASYPLPAGLFKK